MESSAGSAKSGVLNVWQLKRFTALLLTRSIKMRIRARLFHGASRFSLFAVLTLLLPLEIWNVPLAYAEDLAACVDKKTVFDGMVPLNYATVNGSSGLRLYLNAGYSNHCSSADPASCLKTPYLIPGDAVAVGKQCGTRDYVQYIGEKHISEGWVDSAALSSIAPPPPPTPPIFKMGKQILPTPEPSLYRFTLTHGKGLPVCEAYQQRLNQTEFYAPPNCGRPESTLVPGFAALQKRYLTVDEYKGLYFDALDVMNNNPLHYEFKRQKNADGSVSLVPPLDPAYPGFTPGAWSYESPLDIENSDDTDYVMMWTLRDRYYSRCGTASNPDGSIVRGSAVGLVVSVKDKNINRDATYAVFGKSYFKSLSDFRNNFLEFAGEFGAFRYRGLNYFDATFNSATFTTRDFIGTEKQQTYDPNLRNTLAVFLYAHHERKEMCEYRISGPRSRDIDDKSAALAQAAGIEMDSAHLYAIDSPPTLDLQAGMRTMDQLVDESPAVEGAQQDVLAAQSALRRAQGEYGPTVGLTAQRDYLGQSPDGFGYANKSLASADYRVGLQISQPLFPFNSQNADVNKARAQLNKAQASYQQARIEVETKLLGALSARREAERSFGSAQSSLTDAEQVLALTEAQFDAGRTDLDTVEHARMDRDTAQVNLEKFSSQLALAEWMVERTQSPQEFPVVLLRQLHLEVRLPGNDEDR